MILIDGSFGEGGGQIIRSSIALSLHTGQPFRIDKIRAGRAKPGLMRQHLTAVQAAAKIGNAKVDGANVGSTSLTFTPSTAPNPIKPGEYHFAVGTAGSTTLVLQTILPALLLASGPSRIILEGGTHNPFAPPFDFLIKAFLPLVNKMGPSVFAKLERPGFFPAGGGRIVLEIEPAKNLKPITLLDRGELQARAARSVIANLPREIAERELNAVMSRLNWSGSDVSIEQAKDSIGPGNALFIELYYEHFTEVFVGFGERGIASEEIAAAATDQCERYLNSTAPVGEYLADQLLLPMALAGGGSFRTTQISLHTTTHIDLIQKFLQIKVNTAAAKEPNGGFIVTVG